MIVVDNAADKALMAIITELFGLLVEAFAAVVAFDAEFFILTVIAYLAIYAEIIQHAGLAVVIISEFE